ncbi:uncharacterized protein BKA55DRAFT_660351 [Fusarium redolens]|uniref:Uncharacterized protein n=1 Tax=Fusarium redolens TaxID=48865 RepID=A0A9P9KSR5_FUSRE|nr:uncharacterized protein BKA55DRAFT_660351 [Fusarium redolens]KAH7267836.1 hypothetical protein BKA55DRAFT_660351 [Fusarium redolens]
MQRLKRFFLKRYPRLRHEPPVPEPTPTIAPASPSAGAGSSCRGSIDLSRIERLPFEIRNEILLAVDAIADLSSLVHASPTFHQQYRLDRAFWLWHCLKQELGDVLIDAYNVNLYNTHEFRSTRTREKVLLYVEDYKLHRSGGTESLSQQPPEDDVIRIVSFHASVIRTLLQHYITWTWANLDGLSEFKELSRTEGRRIMRGLYRFQIFCSLFGAAHGGGGFYHDDGLLQPEERLQLLLDAFEAWEIEEILCINVFAQAKYRTVFEQVEWDLHPDNPSFDDKRTGPHTPPGAFHLASDMFADYYRNGVVSRGLPVLFAAFEIPSHSELVKLISSEIVSVVEDIVSETTRPYHQETRRENHYSDRDKAQDNREKMSFDGEKYDSPPFAWVVFWKELYSNLYGDFVPPSFRHWGYVMWDKNRLANTDAVAILDQGWKAMYNRLNDEGEPEDPRDEMLAYH